MDAWQAGLERALSWQFFDDEDIPPYLEDFTARWGGTGPDAMRRLLASAAGTTTERLVALLALGFAGAADARDTVAAYLESADPWERWASALALGHMGDTRALPALSRVLTEFLPPDPQYGDSLFWQWRPMAAYTLGKLGGQAAASVLRAALDAAIAAEHAVVESLPARQFGDVRYDMQQVQDHLVYALGLLGAFGALTGLSLDEAHADRWRVELVLGHLDKRHAIKGVYLWRDNPRLLADVDDLLARQFGMNAEERQRALNAYELDKGFEITTLAGGRLEDSAWLSAPRFEKPGGGDATGGEPASE